jgi:hypothetical protein
VSAPAPNISALAKQHGVSRQTIRRRLKNGWDPSIKIVERDQAVATNGHPLGQSPGRDVLQRVHVDLPALKRDIAKWVAFHHAVDRSQAFERRQRIKDRIAQLSFLALAVAFYVLIAAAALHGQKPPG